MKFLKTHYGRAIDVIPSETVNIPNPAGLGLTGTTDSEGSNQLRDGSANFTTNLLGAIVVNTTTNEIANVVGFGNSTILILDANIFSTADGYAIYNSDNNQGCALYIPAQVSSDLTVLTVGGDVIQFKLCGDTNSSSILPVNVLRVFSIGTELTDLIALW
jgi:hypothetical protein